MPRPHGTLGAADVGELVGVSGTTIGQWARRGYIRSSQRAEEPRLYSVEDVSEATAVRALLERGVRRGDLRRAVVLLGRRRRWPLSAARLGTISHRGRARLLVHDGGAWQELSARGWQRVAEVNGIEEVVPRLQIE
jgi:DNA-binding transcriptional MerR regulator